MGNKLPVIDDEDTSLKDFEKNIQINFFMPKLKQIHKFQQVIKSSILY